MIELSNYIKLYEASNTITRGELKIPNISTLIKMYIDLFGDDFYKKCSNKNLRGGTKHTHELIRGFFGETVDDFEENIKKLLTSEIGLHVSDFELKYSENNTDASGAYPSIKITFKDDVSNDRIEVRAGAWLYAINTNSKIQKKQLTPDKLGFAEEDNKFKSVASIKEQLSVNKDNEVLLATLQNLIDEIIVSESGKKYDTLDELMGSQNKYIRKISNIDFEKKDINNLINDFGEILGPCFLLSKLNGDHYVSFPTESNARLYDYELDSTLYISAKAGRGAAPSAVYMAKNAQKLAEGTKNTDPLFDEDAVGDKFYIDTVIPILADETKASKKDSAIIKCQFRLLEALADNNYDDTCKSVIELLKKHGLMYDKKSYMLPREEISKLHSEGKLAEVLEELYKILEYKPSDKFSIKNIDEKWESFKNIDEGCIAYPIRAHVVKVLNAKFAKEITYWAKRAIDGYQLYITYKDDKLEIELKTFGEGEYTLEPSGSVSEPRLKAIACRKKH